MQRLVSTLLMIGALIASAAAQTARQGADVETRELLDALEGRHPTMRRSEAVQHLRQMEEVPDIIVKRLISDVNSTDSRRRIAPRVILRRHVKFDLERAESLLDSLGNESVSYPPSQGQDFLDACRRWAACVVQPGDDVIPLLHREVTNEEKTVVQRTVALMGLGEFEKVPNAVLTDLEGLLSNSGEPWTEAAMILVRQGEAWEQRLVELLKDKNDLTRTRAAGALEMSVPRRHPQANKTLLEIAASDSPAQSEAWSFLGQIRPDNAIEILQIGLTRSDAFNALSRLYLLPENKSQISHDCLPLLKEWLQTESRCDAALRGYRFIGRDNVAAMHDLCDVLRNADEKLAGKITDFIIKHGSGLGVESLGILLLNPATQDDAAKILVGFYRDAGAIATEILQALIDCEISDRELIDSQELRRRLHTLLYQASSFPEESVAKILELDSVSSVYRGHAINWLRKTDGQRAKSISTKLEKWNRQAVLAEITGDFYSPVNPYGKKRTKRAAFSPDGKTIAILGKDQLRFLEAKSGKQVRAVDLPQSVNQWYRPEFSGTGRLIAAAYGDSECCIWDVATGELKASGNFGLKFLSDPRYLLRIPDVDSDQNSIVQIASASNLTTLHQFEFDTRRRWSPDFEERAGVLLTYARSDTFQRDKELFLELREVPSGRLLGSGSFPDLRSFGRRRYSLGPPLLSPNGRYLAIYYTVYPYDKGGFYEIRSTSDLQVVAQMDWTNRRVGSTYPQFTSDGGTLIFRSTDGQLHYWSFEQDRRLHSIDTGTFGMGLLLGDGKWRLQPGRNAVVVDTTGKLPPVSLWFGGEQPEVTILDGGRYFEVATPQRIQLFDTSQLRKYFARHNEQAEIDHKNIEDSGKAPFTKRECK